MAAARSPGNRVELKERLAAGGLISDMIANPILVKKKDKESLLFVPVYKR